ncbi:MAG TPA: glycosyl hydrolase [Bryobacteraceae bacterium]|nr:glycosyl hydrolase [Bryobacteraceae bacterium]
MQIKHKGLTRRTLMKSVVAAAPAWRAVRAEENDALFRAFQEPPVTARPFVRWWWNGDKLAAREILRELDLLHAAGIGGVEVNPIRFPNPDDPLNIPEIEWLSRPWIGMLQTAVQGAHERGMIADSIVGSGWPFGGQFLTREEQTHILALGTRRLTGPGAVRIAEGDLLAEAELTLHSKWKSIDKSIRYLRLAPRRMDQFAPGTDVTAQLTSGELTLDVPEGEHILYILVQQRGFQAVINGAPGADGPVLNHFNAAAVERYLDRMSSAIEPVMGPLGKSFRAMFCDSLELEGANWCSDMLPVFEARRGYSLLPYLPFVLFKTGEMGNPTANQNQAELGDAAREAIERVRYDFLTLQMELFSERFTRTYRQWCARNGVKARVQAYGPAYHPLESSLEVDIPECETWMNAQIGLRGHRAPTGINKFVSSAAHFSGKRLVSCEEVTNTSMVFNATLAGLKNCADQSNLSGVTHSIFHGFNYSPAEAPFPGWVRYGTFFNERNPWWPFVRHFTDYKARLSAVLQNCDPRTEVAILHPFADLWMTHGLQREPFPVLHMPSYQYQLWEAIHQNGSGCDYVDEKLLAESQCAGGRLVVRGRTYGALIVMEALTVEPETARAMERFATGGGRIVFIRHAPSRSPRFQNRQANDAEVQAASERILRDHGVRCAVVEPPGDDILAWYGRIQQQFGIQPYMRIARPDVNLSQIALRSGEREIFFFANSDAEREIETDIDFSTGAKTPWQWNPETGERLPYFFNGNRNRLSVSLEPCGSLLLVFEPGMHQLAQRVPRPSEARAATIDGPWQVELRHVDGTSQPAHPERAARFQRR